jgi:5'-phosphate synthase pdxT subunit
VDSSIISGPTKLGGDPLEMVFIRAPRIEKTGKGVEVIAEREGHPVLVKQENILAATFHPELSNDSRVHELFLEMVRKSRNGTESR